VLDHLRRAGCRITEVPITYVDRQHGRTKISRRIILEALYRTTLLGARRAFGR
jgi:dolichol-phosphate mannosyltransferase